MSEEGEAAHEQANATDQPAYHKHHWANKRGNGGFRPRHPELAGQAVEVDDQDQHNRDNQGKGEQRGDSNGVGALPSV